MKIYKFLIFLFIATNITLAQNVPSPIDSTKSLFKTPKYSYMQWDVGYQNIAIKSTNINTFDATFLGFVLNEKWFLALGLTAGAKNKPVTYFLTHLPPKIDSYFASFINIEYLAKPKNVINFSFPLRITYGGASGWDTIFSSSSSQSISNWNFTGKNYYQHYGDFWSVSAGANMFVNIFKSLSLGFGANYRYALKVNSEIGTTNDFSNYSLRAFLRIKFDSRAYMAKMIERQKQYLKSMQ